MHSQKQLTTLALVGAGQWGKNYITTIESLDGIHLKYVCARTTATLKTLPNEYQTTTDYRELLVCPDIDGVIIATPPQTHYKLAREFLKHDFSLLIEKPITIKYREVLELAKLHNKKKNTIVMVGHVRLYDPAYIEIKKRLKNIRPIKKILFKGLQSPIRKDSTVLEDWGPHPISIFLDILGYRPKSVHAKKTTNDNVHITLQFNNGVICEADIGWTAPQRMRKLLVIGENGEIDIDNIHKSQKLSDSPLAQEVLEFVSCIKSGREPKTGLIHAVAVTRIIDSLRRRLSSPS